MAPGEGITSLGTGGSPLTLGGTSVAVPFVTGTIALLWSEFPDASAVEVRSAVTGGGYTRRRTTVVPPLLDAWAAYEAMAKVRSWRGGENDEQRKRVGGRRYGEEAANA
jgi:subtilisin family serine protease